MGTGAGRLYGGFDEGPITAERVDVEVALFDGLFDETLVNAQLIFDFLDDNVLSDTDNEAKFLLLDQTSPQTILNDSPIFNVLIASKGVYTDASQKLTSTPPTSGILGHWDRAGTVLSPSNAGDNIATTGFGAFDLGLVVPTNQGVVSGDMGTDANLALLAGSDNGVIGFISLIIAGITDNMTFTNDAGASIAFTPGSIIDSTGTINFGNENLTTTGTLTSGDITIFNPTPILVFKDSNSLGAASVGFIEWQDSGGGRAGFFGNSSSGNSDLLWKNEQGGNIAIQTTGAGELDIIATLAQFNATPITTTGTITGNTLTDGTLSITGGDITNGGNATFNGSVSAFDLIGTNLLVDFINNQVNESFVDLTATGVFDVLNNAIVTAGTGRFDSGLLDSGDNVAIDLDGYSLTYFGAVTVDWSQPGSILYDSGPLASIKWAMRQAIAEDGSDIILDWSTVGLAQFGDSNLITTGTLGSGLHNITSNAGSPNIAIDIKENSGSEDWQIGVDSAGSLRFYNSGATAASFILLDSATGSADRKLEIANGQTNLHMGNGGVAGLGYTFWGKSDGGVESLTGGLFSVSNDDRMTRMTLANGPWNSDVRTEFVFATQGNMEIYGQSPNIEQHALRTTGGVAINAIEHWFQKGTSISGGGTDTKVMEIGTHGQMSSEPASGDFVYINVGTSGFGANGRGIKFGQDGSMSIGDDSGSGREPLNLIWAEQFEDDNGLKILGFDDQSAEFIHIYLDSAGETHIVPSDPMYIDLDSILFIGAAATNLTIESDGDTYWTGAGAGLPFGEAHQADGQTFTVTMTTQDDWFEVDAATTNISATDLNLVTFPDDHYLLCLIAGKYFVTYSMTGNINSVAGGDQHIESGIMINGSIQIDKGIGHEQFRATGREKNLQGHTIIDVPANGQVSLALKNTTSSGKVLTIDHVNITVTQVGGS